MKVWTSVSERVALYALPALVILLQMFYMNPSAIYLSAGVSVHFRFECSFCAVFLYQTILGGIWCGGNMHKNIISLPVFFSWKHICLSPTFPNSPDVFQSFSFPPSPSPMLAASALVPRHQLKTQQGPHTQWALIGLSLSATDNISLSVENKTNCWH